MLKKILLYIGVGFVLGALIAFVYLASNQSTTSKEPLLGNDPNTIRELNQQTAEVVEKVNESRETFNVDRDYESAIAENQRALELAQEYGDRVDINREAAVKMNLASKLLRTDPAEGIKLYGEVYNNTDYHPERRAAALLSVMWHTSSGILLGFESVDFYVEEVYRKDKRFADVLSGEIPNDVTSLRLSTIDGFRKVLDMAEDEQLRAKAHGFLATYIALNADPESSKRSVDSDTIEQVRFHVDETTKTLFKITNRAILESTHDQDVLPLFTTSLKALGDLSRWGEDVIDDVRQVSSTIQQYYTALRTQSYAINVFTAGALFRSMCIELDHADQDVSKVDVEYLQKLIEPHKNLEDEDYERQGVIASLADQPEDFCHDSVVSMGNIDPEYKSLLINKIGGWEISDFN